MPTLIPEFTHTPSRQNPATFSADMDSRLSEENSRIVAMNAQSTENNAAVVTTTTNANNTATNASSAAISAATATAAALRAEEAVLDPTGTAYATGTANWRDTMRSKATFNGAANEVKFNRAGSGFDEFGLGSATTTLNVNEGMVTFPTTTNFLAIGRTEADTISGTSKTRQAYTAINGVISKLAYTGLPYNSVSIFLPQAPTVLPSTATLTQQQIDSGVIKHADASNSGLIVNGKFDTDTSGWTTSAGTLSIESGYLKITVVTNTYTNTYQNVTTIVGKKYKVEVTKIDGTSASAIGIGNGTNNTDILNWTTLSNGTRHEFEFTAIGTSTRITFGSSNVDGQYFRLDNIAVLPADAISRSDLVFLESWHEDVSEKDFVYPLGNVQYLGTTGDAGTPVAGSFAGAATYSLFSDTWQADSALIGKGYVWSTLSDANKKAFVANPENNCYLDGDKVIQVRYRMRVVMGDSDTFANIDPQTGTSGYFRVNTSGYGYIAGKGKLTSIASELSGSSWYFGVNYTGTDAKIGAGHYAVRKHAILGDLITYGGDTAFALPIALVHRRNQGFMHPVYNPNGTKLASDSLPWYSTTVSFTSIADCFTDSKLLTASGYIGTTTGRADGLFYDQVHEADITDLRMSSKVPTDYNRLIDKEFNRLVAGTYRGSQGELNTEVKTQTTTGTVATVEVNDGTKYKSGDTIYIYDLTASAVKGRYVVKSISTNTLTVDVAFAKLANSYMISGGSTTRTKSNTITITDMIGSPANLPATMKLDGQSFNTLHTAEDGTSLLPTGTTGSDGLAVYKLSHKANATPLQVLKSTDSGATWTALTVTTHYTFSTTTNAITFTAGNIPLMAHLIMVTYQTKTNMAVPAVNSEVLAIGGAIGVSEPTYNNGGTLCSSLIGKIALSTTAPTVSYGNSISKFYIANDFKFSAIAIYSPVHDTISLGATISPAVKVFPYLTRSTGKAYLQLVFKEMKYGSYAAPTVVTAASATYTVNMTYKINIAGCALDGKVIQWTATTTTVAIDWSLYDVSPTGVIYLLSSGAVYANARLYDGDSWGDDSKFNIVDNVSTTTDTNGATVLIGQKRIELPYFIGASE